MPNLDLINLCHRMCIKEDIRNTFKHKLATGSGKRKHVSFSMNQWLDNFHTMMNMVLTQATGVSFAKKNINFYLKIELIVR